MNKLKKILLVFGLLSGWLSFAQNQSTEAINALMNNWHRAAAVADADIFFGSMTADAHYIGTDEAEDWTRDEMRNWAKEIFKRDSAWDFKTIKRNIYLAEDNKLGWFDETLDTWMGVCRGSGVVVLTEEGWKIKHYVLSVAVPNSVIDDYINIYKRQKSVSKP